MEDESNVRFMLKLLKEKTDQCEELEKLIYQGGGNYSNDKKRILLESNRELKSQISIAEKELNSLNGAVRNNVYAESLDRWAHRINRDLIGEDGYKKQVISDMLIDKMMEKDCAEKNGINIYRLRIVMKWIQVGYEEKLLDIGFDKDTAEKLGHILRDVEIIRQKMPDLIPIDDTPGSEESKLISTIQAKGKLQYHLWLLGYRTRDIAYHLKLRQSGVRNAIANEMVKLYGKENIDRLNFWGRSYDGFFDKMHSEILELGVAGMEKKYQMNKGEATNVYNLSRRVQSIIGSK